MTSSSATPLAVQPPPLRPGDIVRIIAPSGPFDRTLVWRGMGFLSERYRVRFEPGLFSSQGFLAGSDARRRAELETAIADPDTRAILTARGGYGLTRFIHDVDLSGLRKAPKWVVGFSDITALHVELARAGVQSIHGANVAGLGRGDARGRQLWVDTLEGRTTAASYSKLQCWGAGVAPGPLLGGNLTMLSTCSAAGRLQIPQGSVLFIEDVAEAPYRIDRMLSSLETSGTLARCCAFIVGTMTDCPPGSHGVSVESVLRERLGHLHVPILAGLQAGHSLPNVPLVLGQRCTVDADTGRFTMGS